MPDMVYTYSFAVLILVVSSVALVVRHHDAPGLFIGMAEALCYAILVGGCLGTLLALVAGEQDDPRIQALSSDLEELLVGFKDE